MNEPTLHSHTHYQAAKANRTIQSLSISVSEPTLTDGRKKSTIAQQCIRAIAGEVVKSRSVHLINFCGGGQVIALKSATALILDRWRKSENEQKALDKRKTIQTASGE